MDVGLFVGPRERAGEAAKSAHAKSTLIVALSSALFTDQAVRRMRLRLLTYSRMLCKGTAFSNRWCVMASDEALCLRVFILDIEEEVDSLGQVPLLVWCF